MRTTHRAIMCVAVSSAMTLIGMSDTAHAAPPPAPPTNIVGSWSCLDAPPFFLLSFHDDGTFTAVGSELSVSVNIGVWERTGLNTFDSRDLAFMYGVDGSAEYVQETTATTTMLDNDNLNGDFVVVITDLNGNVVDTLQATASCTRIQI